MHVLEWVVLIAASLWALTTNIIVRQHYKESKAPTIPANTFALVQLLSVIGVVVLRRSPLHLLWLFPLSYLAGFIALRSNRSRSFLGSMDMFWRTQFQQIGSRCV